MTKPLSPAYRRVSGLVLVLTAFFLAPPLAAGSPAVDPSHGVVYAGPLHVPGSIELYPLSFELLSGNPNHPDRDELSLRRDACPSFPLEVALRLSSSSGYGLSRSELCLDLETGNLFSRVTDANDQIEESTVSASEGGRSQLVYARALAALKAAAQRFREGNYKPDYGFYSPERPALAGLVAYLGEVERLYLQGVSDLIDINFPREADPGRTLTLMPSVLSSKDRDLLVVQRDRTKVYSLERVALSAGLQGYPIDLLISEQVQDPASFLLQLVLVPRGGGLESVLDLREQTLMLKSKDRIESFFCALEGTSGQQISCWVGSDTRLARDVRVDIFAPSRAYLTGRQLGVEEGYQITSWTFELEETLAPGAYPLYAKILPRGGDWSQKLAEKAFILTVP